MDSDRENYEFHVAVVGAAQGRFPDDDEESKGKGARCYTFEYGAGASNDATRATDFAARFHEPVYIAKAWSESSANFLQAFLTNEVLTTVSIEFVRKDPAGKSVVFETHTLTNATMVSLRRTVGKTPGLPFGEIETIGLRFEAMEIKSPKKSVKFDFKNRK